MALVPPEVVTVMSTVPGAAAAGATALTCVADTTLNGVPTAVVTVTSTAGGVAVAGATAAICVSELTVNEVAAAASNLTDEAPVRAEPVMVTLVPPASGPADGDTPVTVGAPTMEYADVA